MVMAARERLEALLYHRLAIKLEDWHPAAPSNGQREQQHSFVHLPSLTFEKFIAAHLEQCDDTLR